MPRELHPENLKTPTTEQARKIGRMGGLKSAKVKKEKKLLSQIYAEILASKNGINGSGKTIADVAGEILLDKGLGSNASKVSMMKEIREATEGTKSQITGANGEPLIPQKIQIEFLDADSKA
ncbi:hypothetical protein [Polynucleobacter sp.]|uniref:hypothetical protein n=1 Tax=Polynucleobacter sp. TaxID=2029855 RepID=UPI003F6A2C7E